MKRLKFALLAVLFSAIGAMGFSSASAQTTYSITYNPTGSSSITFANGATSTTQTNKIKNSANWGSFVTPPTTSCPGATNLCGLEIIVPAGQSLPSITDLITALHDWYRDTNLGNFSFPDGASPFTLTIGGVNYTITTFLRSAA
jgi:hypothetical protein